MWRRSGMVFRRESGGRALTLANKTLLYARERIAGMVVDAAAFCLIDDTAT